MLDFFPIFFVSFLKWKESFNANHLTVYSTSHFKIEYSRVKSFRKHNSSQFILSKTMTWLCRVMQKHDSIRHIFQ